MLVGDAPHAFIVVGILQLPPGNVYAIAWFLVWGNGWTAGVVVRIWQPCPVLLHQFVGDSIARKFMAENPPVAHPVVRIHPETKKPVLYVSPHYTGEIVGMQRKKGEELLAYLFGEVTRPDYQMRVRWELGTIVVWDNRSVLHYAVHDYNEPRVMERVTVSGDEPVGFPEPSSSLS